MSNKYQRQIKPGVYVDVYDVLNAFGVTNPGAQHAVKKVLAAGQRGHKDMATDYREAIASLERAIDLEDPSIQDASEIPELVHRCSRTSFGDETTLADWVSYAIYRQGEDRIAFYGEAEDGDVDYDSEFVAMLDPGCDFLKMDFPGPRAFIILTD